MEEIEYTSVEQQVEKLQSQNLIISDIESAKKRLEIYGYSNLIKSYRDPYVYTYEDVKLFRSETTFDQVYSLFIFDKNLRNAVMASMLDLEEFIKEAAADVIAKSFGTNPDDYLKYRNYQNKRKSKYRFSLPGILDIMKKTLDTDKNPIFHYKEKYGTVPPWILFKSVYLSTIINFIDLMKSEQQEMMVYKIYGGTNGMPIEKLIQLMMDTLFICLEYRNMAAHGGRIYNFKCKRELRFSSEIEHQTDGFSQLLQILSLMKYKAPYKHLHRVLNDQLNKHCSQYPQDVTYLGQILNLNISSWQIVWTTEKSNKYHFNKYCSGMQNAKEIEISEAQKQGLIECKKCCK